MVAAFTKCLYLVLRSSAAFKNMDALSIQEMFAQSFLLLEQLLWPFLFLLGQLCDKWRERDHGREASLFCLYALCKLFSTNYERNFYGRVALTF